MFTDERRCGTWNEIGQHELRSFSRLLTPTVLAEAAAQCGRQVGQSALNLANLAWLGISAALHGGRSFADVLVITLKVLQDQSGFGETPLGRAQKSGRAKAKKKAGKPRSKHDPRRDDPTQVSEEAFVKARQRMPLEFWFALLAILGERFAQQHEHRLRFKGHRLLAMDGTYINLPNYQTLKKHFGTPQKGSRADQAQALMVMLQFPLTRMPYRYELGSLDVGEVTMGRRLIANSLRPGDLLLLDAGYWSYGLFCDVQRLGTFFAIRVDGRAKIKHGRWLGQGDRLATWSPRDSRGQWRKEELPKSIKLRLISYQIRGFRKQTIATNLLDPADVSRQDWTRLTTECETAGRRLLPGLWHKRWDIEVGFRELKVDQGLERNLRGRTPKSIHYEVASHVVLYLLVRWLIVEAAVPKDLDPLRISFLNAYRELLDMRPSLITATPQFAAQVLLPRLLERIASHVVPFRPGRHYPRGKNSCSSRRKRRTTNKG